MTHSFTILTPSHRAELDALIAIYQEAIEPSEQKVPSEIQGMLSDTRCVLTVSRTFGEIAGFTIAQFPVGADFWLLEYMAVATNLRRRGVGEALFGQAYRYGLQRDRERLCLLEVDQTGNRVSANNNAEDRVRFYRRLGCRLVSGLNYLLPLEANGAPPPQMLLTYRLPPLESVGKDTVREWLSTIYRDIYGKPVSDPRIGTMVSNLPEVIRINCM